MVAVNFDGPILNYTGPHQEVLSIASATISQGSILQIVPPDLNATWQVEFSGPSIACTDLEAEQREFLTGRFICKWEAIDLNYASWTDSLDPYFSNYSLKPTSDPAELGTWPLYVAAFQRDSFFYSSVPDPESEDCSGTTADNPALASHARKFLEQVDPTYLECDFRNSSYSVAFKYVYGQQEIEANVTHGETVSPPDETIMNGGALDEFLFESIRGFVYRSIFDAFRAQVVGSVYVRWPSVEQHFGPTALGLSMTKTQELSYLVGPKGGYGSFMSHLAKWVGPVTLASKGAESVHDTRPLKEVLEELFQNVTISMMSSDRLQ
jgi:hypothetical protein